MNERLPFLRDKTKKLTTSPGVYLMKDKTGKIIYVGKAKNLKNRVTSYFREHPDHLPKVAKMVSNVFDYDFIVTDSEYEALVLECSLIKQYSPKYNILLKDDKGYFYIKISAEEYPRITAVMQKDDEKAEYLGPYTSGLTTKQSVNEANSVFMLPTCTRKFPQEFRKGRPCLNFHIKKCMGLCQGKVSVKDYKKTVYEAVDYIRSGSALSVERLEKEMNEAAENFDFERAAVLRDRILAIKKAADTQKIITDRKDTDVIAFAKASGTVSAAVLIYRGGRLYDKLNFFLGEDDEGDICGFIGQFYQGNNDIPKEILIEEEFPEKEIVERMLREKSGHAVNIVTRIKGDGAKLIAMAKSNASEYLSFKAGRTGKEIVALEELGKLLGMDKIPEYIESYDISNLGSTGMVAGMVVFNNGRPLKSAYRKFSMKENVIQNDVGCMKEIVKRRFTHYVNGDEGFDRMPDLILVDGGTNQVNAVKEALSELSLSTNVFGMVKDNKHRTRAIATSGEEISVSDMKPAFFLLTRIQDEVHRFAITYQRSTRKKGLQSDLLSVKGIGEKKAMKLMKHFKTIKALSSASTEEISKVAGVSEEIAKEILSAMDKR
ncbi:MAG: excinuclease ABC subunit UvrC [Oscillospiraceae bacterium]|nr:excinuclease ABC subunit UvrC [Oscillospiraceae bacterium]